MNYNKYKLWLLTVALVLGMLPISVPAYASNPVPNSAAPSLFLPSISKQAQPCFTQIQPSIFGIQKYGNSGPSGRYYQEMMDTGVDWVRIPIRWKRIEPVNVEPDKFLWSSADQAVQAALDGSCKRIIVTHQTAPDWAAEDPESLINTENLDDFEQYLTALVERYDGDGVSDAPGSPVVLYWEMYNEPDASTTVLGYEGWGEFVPEYIQMLKIARTAIKSANPQAKIIFGGIAHDFFGPVGPFVEPFVINALDAGAADVVDIFNFHSYPGFSERWIRWANPDCVETESCIGPGLLEKNDYIRSLLAQHGHPNMPIMVTETGWYSEPDPEKPSNEEIHARYVTQVSVQSKAAGVAAMIQFSLVDPDTTSHDYGLVTTLKQRKKAFKAYQTVVERLGQATYIRRLDAAETGHAKLDAYQFTDPTTGRTFYVAWYNPAELGEDLDGDGEPDERYATRMLDLPANEVAVYDIYNNLQATTPGAAGEVSIPVGSQPSYIVVTK